MPEIGSEIRLIDVERDDAYRESLANAWAGLIKEFLSNSATYMRPRSVQFYRLQLMPFHRWVTAELIEIKAFRQSHLENYLAHRATHGGPDNRGVAPKTRSNDAEAVRRLCQFAKRRNKIDKNPVKRFRVKKLPKPYVYTPTVKEIKKLLDAVDKFWSIKERPDEMKYIPEDRRDKYSAMHRAVVAVLVATGMRIGQEVLNIRLSDLLIDDPKNLRIIIREGKGGAAEEVPIMANCVKEIRKWLNVRPAAIPSQFVFVTRNGTPLQYGTFRKSFANYRKLAGLPQLTIHGVRHYSANTMADVSVRMAQTVLRHKSVTTTEDYLSKSKIVREKYDVADPLGQALRSDEKMKKETYF